MGVRSLPAAGDGHDGRHSDEARQAQLVSELFVSYCQ